MCGPTRPTQEPEDANVAEYAAPGNMFGIDFIHEPM